MEKIVGIILIIMCLVSCSGYHYVSTMPVVPEFEKAGQIDGAVSLNKGFLQYQGSISVTKNIGIYHNGLRAGPSSINGVGILGFGRFGKQKQFALFGRMGYEKGFLYASVDENPINFTPSYTSKFNYASTFERHSGMIGFQAHHPEQPQIHFGLYLGIQEIQFFRLYTDHTYRESGNSGFWAMSNKQTERVQIVSPSLSFTYSFLKGAMYYRQIISLDMPDRTYIDGEYANRKYNHLTQTYYTTYTPGRLNIESPVAYIAGAIGIHLDALSWFKKK